MKMYWGSGGGPVKANEVCKIGKDRVWKMCIFRSGAGSTLFQFCFTEYRIRGCIQKFPDWVDNEITTTTTTNTLWEATQRVMAAKLLRLTHKIAIQLHLVAHSCTICSSRSRWPVRELLDTPSYPCSALNESVCHLFSMQIMTFRIFSHHTFNVLPMVQYSRDSSVSTATELRTGRLGF
jgi:hypothetical protein